MKSIFIGAGTDLGIHIDGCSLAPTQLERDIKGFYKGEIEQLETDKSIIKSRGLSDRSKNKYEINEFNEILYKKILEKIRHGYFPITVGGDKTVTIPSSLADARYNEEIGLIVIGPRADYNTLDTTDTGNINGFTTACVTGFKNEELRTFHRGEIIQASKTVLVGPRSMNDKEKDNLKYSGITVFSTDDIKKEGAKQIIEKAFSIATYKTKSVHICFDLGIIGPEVISGISIPIFDGVDDKLAMELNDNILEHFNKVSGYDLVEFNPLRDTGRKTEQIALNILYKTIEKINELPDKEIEEEY